VALAGMLIFCHSVLLQLWRQFLVDVSALQVAELRFFPNQLPVIGDTEFFGCGHVTYVMSVEPKKFTLLEKGLVS